MDALECFTEGFFENELRRDPSTNEGAQIFCAVDQGEAVRVGAGKGEADSGSPQPELVAGFKGGEEDGLAWVQGKARCIPELLEELEPSFDALGLRGKDGNVVEKATGDNTFLLKEKQERVNGNDKQERGERAALLNTLPNWDDNRSVRKDCGGDADVGKEASDKVNKETGEAHVLEDRKEESVVEGVKRLSKIGHEDGKLRFHGAP